MSGRSNVKFKRKAFDVAYYKGGSKALRKSAAYIRGIAKRKVKRRKNKRSKPGQPPFAHSGIFKASILYALDKRAWNSKTTHVSAYVGPQRLFRKRTNYAGQPVSEILEKGGMAALGMNANWIHKSCPREVKDLNSMASYFKKLGKGPASWGRSPEEADAKIGRNNELTAASSRVSTKTGKVKSKRHPRRFSPVMRKRVYLAYITIKTDEQARKVAQTVIDVFGYPATNRPIKIAPRPLMGPSLRDSKTFIAQCFNNALHK